MDVTSLSLRLDHVSAPPEDLCFQNGSSIRAHQVNHINVQGKARIDVQHKNVGVSGDPQAVINSSFGPVLLLHLPLYRHDDGSCDSVDIPRCAPWHDLEGSCIGAAVLPPL